MLKKTIPFTNFDGKQVTETHYFNLTMTELVKWEMETNEGILEMFSRLAASNDRPALSKAFNDLLLKSYGIKSDDGNRHMKNDEIRANFEASAAYDAFFMEFFTTETTAAQFIRGVMPKEMLTDEVIQQVMETGDERVNAIARQMMPPPPPPLPPSLTNEAVARGQAIMDDAGMG